MILQFQIERKNKIENSSRTAWGGYLTDSVTIKQNVWIGANVIILKGVTIYENSVVSAGSIVTKDVPANTILIQKRTNTLINK